MRNGTRNFLLAATAALMVGGHGAARAEEAPARLAIYVNGALDQYVAGAARLTDVPYREDTSDPRTRWELEAVHCRGLALLPRIFRVDFHCRRRRQRWKERPEPSAKVG
jgi:hypothetical protein